jgi:hypothetical protein
VRFVRLVIALLSLLAGLASVARSPRRVVLELLDDTCYVTRGHPAFPDKARVLQCRIEQQGDEIIVRGPEAALFLGAREHAAAELDRVRKNGEVSWSGVDGLDLGLAAIAFVFGAAVLRSARAKDPEEAYVDEVVHAFHG